MASSDSNNFDQAATDRGGLHQSSARALVPMFAKVRRRLSVVFAAGLGLVACSGEPPIVLSFDSSGVPIATEQADDLGRLVVLTEGDGFRPDPPEMFDDDEVVSGTFVHLADISFDGKSSGQVFGFKMSSSSWFGNDGACLSTSAIRDGYSCQWELAESGHNYFVLTEWIVVTGLRDGQWAQLDSDDGVVSSTNINGLAVLPIRPTEENQVDVEVIIKDAEGVAVLTWNLDLDGFG